MWEEGGIRAGAKESTFVPSANSKNIALLASGAPPRSCYCSEGERSFFDLVKSSSYPPHSSYRYCCLNGGVLESISELGKR